MHTSTRAAPALERFFDRVMSPFLLGAKGYRNRWKLLAGVLIADRAVGIAGGR